MTTTSSTDLVITRESLHRVAEHVLAAARKRATGRITLTPSSGGFRTPQLPDGTVLAVDGVELVVAGEGGQRRAPLRTVAQAAAFAGVRAGFPSSKSPPGTPFEPDQLLEVDTGAAAALAGWFALGQQALDVLAAEIAAEQPTPPQLFPEHFDLGMTAGAVNYGFSPGDASIADPYVYVGPHDLDRLDGDFWNASFGAYRTWQDVVDTEHALRFLRAGHDALAL